MVNSSYYDKRNLKWIFKSKRRQKKAEKILGNKERVEKLLNNARRSLDNIPIIGKYFSDIPTLCFMVRDYASGNYKDIPFGSIIMIVIALVYFVSPIDFIPDIIPIAGYLDDAFFVTQAIKTIHNDIADYKEIKGFCSEKAY